MNNGHSQQTIGAFFGQNGPFTRFNDGAVESVESAHQVGMTVHRFPNPVIVFGGRETGEQPGQFIHGIGEGGQTASIAGHAVWRPVGTEEPPHFLQVGMKEWMVGQFIARQRPPFFLAATQNGGVFAGTGVKPSTRPANLTTELNQRHVQWRLHVPPAVFR